LESIQCVKKERFSTKFGLEKTLWKLWGTCEMTFLSTQQNHWGVLDFFEGHFLGCASINLAIFCFKMDSNMIVLLGAFVVAAASLGMINAASLASRHALGKKSRIEGVQAVHVGPGHFEINVLKLI
jgi:hypothetical protein